MAKRKSKWFTKSTIIFMTATMMTRIFTFGLIMVSVYMQVGDDILDHNFVKVADAYEFSGIPYGSALRSLAFSLAGVFGLELLTGIIGLYGTMARKKPILVVTMVLSCLLLVIYCTYTVLFGILYGKRYEFKDVMVYYLGLYNRRAFISTAYQYEILYNFVLSLECDNGFNAVQENCWSLYSQKLDSYVQIYFALIATCLICQVISIISIEYTYRKVEIKEKGERISNKTYKLLLTKRHGLLRSCVSFIRNAWNQSRLTVVSVIFKLISLISGSGLLLLGIVIISNELIINGELRYILYRLEFYDYYLYDIIVGLAAASTVIGLLTIVITTASLAASWRKSTRLLMMSTVTSIGMHIPRLTCVFLWLIFVSKINNELKLQLFIQQEGYFETINYQNHHTAWNTMIQKLDCCGVYNISDMDSKDHFCYENAKEISMYPSESYSNYNNLDNSYYGRGNKRTTTCTDRLLWQLHNMIGWFTAIVLLQILTEVVGYFFVNKEYTEIRSTKDYNGQKYGIIETIWLGLKNFYLAHFKRPRFGFIFTGSFIAFTLLNFGLLVLGIQIRYDNVFGNRYLRSELLDMSIASFISLNKILDDFHIVVTTFSLASFTVSIYIIASKALNFERRFWYLSSVALMMCGLMVASIVQIGLWGKVTTDAPGDITEGLQSEFQFYALSDKSASHYSMSSVAWNTMFIKARCCGVGSVNFTKTTWYSSRASGDNRQIPEYCCKNESVLYPYSDRSNEPCTTLMSSDTYYTVTCDKAINKRFKTYSGCFFALSTLVIITQTLIIILTVNSRQKLNQETELDFRQIKENEGEKNEIKNTILVRPEKNEHKSGHDEFKQVEDSEV